MFAKLRAANGTSRCNGASLVTQLVKNPPAMQESLVRFLGQKDLLEKGWATHSSILAWRISMDRGAWRATVHRVAKSRTQLKWLCMHAYIWPLPSWTPPLPPPSPRLSQSTSFGFPASYIELPLALCFTYGICFSAILSYHLTLSFPYCVQNVCVSFAALQVGPSLLSF